MWCKLIALFLTLDLCALPRDLLSNWENPTLDDLRTAQMYLDEQFSSTSSDEYGFRTARITSFKLFDPSCTSYPLYIKKGNDSSICVICYSSINSRYESLLKRLIESLQKSHFPGDIVYRIGGWPNMNHGGILLCDTPYAFKISAFEEALRLGYKQALWLDLSVVALNDLSQVFKKIKKNGAYFRKSFFPLNTKNIVTPHLAESYNMTVSSLEAITHYAAGVLGLNLESPTIRQLLANWHRFAEQKAPFKSSFPEQVPFSVLVNKYGLDCALCPLEEIVFASDQIRQTTNFLISY